MSNINRVPAGLLGLLGLKSLGKAPDGLLGTVQGSLELLQFWAASGLTHIYPSSATPGVNDIGVTQASLEVPNGKSWLLFGFGVAVFPDSASGEAGSLLPAAWAPSGVATVADRPPQIAWSSPVNTVAGLVGARATDRQLPLILPSGWILGACVGSSGASGFQGTGDVQFALSYIEFDS